MSTNNKTSRSTAVSPRNRSAGWSIGELQRVGYLILILWSMLFVLNRDASADVVWLIGKDRPIFGIVESQNETMIEFRQTEDGRNFKDRTLNRNEIDSLLVNRDTDRLESLSPENLSQYFLYAEELVPQKQDPVARNLAIRLLVIVAGNSGDATLQQAALKNLLVLARSETERTSFEDLLYFETGIAKNRVAKETVKTDSDQQKRLAALKLVQMIRQEKSLDDQLSSEELRPTIDAFESTCSWQELIRISKSNRIDNQQLRRLVALERRLRMKPGASIPDSSTDPWNALAKRIASVNVNLPTIDSVTEFAPSDVFFAGGTWTQTRPNP